MAATATVVWVRRPLTDQYKSEVWDNILCKALKDAKTGAITFDRLSMSDKMFQTILFLKINSPHRNINEAKRPPKRKAAEITTSPEKAV